MNKESSLINLCSHDVVIKDASGENRTICPAGKECRADVLPKDVHYHDGVAVFTDVYGDVENLPAPKDGVMYIVSARVTNALNGSRKDVVSPGRQIKDKSGKVTFSIGLRRKF